VAKNREVTEENGRQHVLLEGTQKLFWAGLGMVKIAQDELGDLTDRLVEKGEATEKETRERFDEFIAARRKQAKKRTRQVESSFDKRMEDVLHRFSIPTRSEIKSLNNKISQLSKKVDELNKS
jgi:poly(hydroxyalkanoate) granule-associated protein